MNSARREIVTPALQFRDQLQVADSATIERLVAATGFFSAEEVTIAVELADETLAKGAASGYEFLFAEAGETVVGYSCYGHIAGTQSAFDLYWIAVAPECQGKGIGQVLLATTESRIHDAGGTGVYVETSSRDLYRPTQAFYSACGYQLAATLPEFYAPGDAKLIYFKSV